MFASLRKSSEGSLGLDVDSGFLAAVHVVDGRIKRAVSTEIAPGIMSEGEVVEADALTDALNNFFKTHSLPRQVYLGVANRQIAVRQLELPRIEGEREQQAAVRFQAAETIAMPLDEAVLDYQEIGESITPEGAARTRLVVVAAREAMIARLVDAARAASLKPRGIDLNAFALVRALAGSLPASERDDAARVYCHLAGMTNFAVAVGSSCLFTRPLSTVLNGGDGAAALAEEIRVSIDSYTAQPDARWVTDIVLSGPGSNREGLAQELGTMIGPPVTVANPLANLDPAGLAPGEDPYRHTVATGLALGAAE